jgi:hypothetical protein
MKLELKHLAPYLPYGLNFMHNGKELLLFSLELPNDQNQMWITGLINYKEDSQSISVFPQGCKPILIPMLDLRNDRESIIELKLFVKADLDFTISGPPDGTYDEVQYLLSKHYDVFGLLEKRLAIDINTLNK